MKPKIPGLDVTSNRRSLISSAALLGAGMAVPAMARKPDTRPNFLFIMADDMGYADLSCYGRTEYQTPAIDALARQGMRFTHAYANSAVCTASRVALVTGRYQYRLPIGLEEPLGNRDIGLPPDEPTMASLLKASGYATSLIGKWHLGALPKYGPHLSGYDEFWGLRGGGVDYFSHGYAGRDDLWDGQTPVKDSHYLTDLLGDHAIAGLERYSAGQKPWLMSLHFTAPHWPWEGPEDIAESERLTKVPDRLAIMDYDGGTLATYAAMMQRLDFQVGRILSALKRLLLDRNTVVVFTSDNGGERFSKTWPFSGRKTELLEGGLRIPAIVRWPGLVRAGSTSDAQVMTMDWLPTFLASAGGTQESSRPSDGMDIRPVLAGGAMPERTLYWRYKYLTQRAARRGKWKYLEISGKTFLFDVEADPMERANLKNRFPDVYAELTKAWTAWDKTMLPLDPLTQSHGFTGSQLADHFGNDD